MGTFVKMPEGVSSVCVEGEVLEVKYGIVDGGAFVDMLVGSFGGVVVDAPTPEPEPDPEPDPEPQHHKKGKR